MTDHILIFNPHSAQAKEWAEAIACDDLVPEMVDSLKEAYNILSARFRHNYRLLVCRYDSVTQEQIDELNQLQRTCDIPVLFCLPALPSEASGSNQAFAQHATIRAPFSARDLVTRIRQIVKYEAPLPVSDAVPISHFVMRDFPARILYRGHTLELEKREYLLLKILLDAQGEMVTRAHLMEKICPNHRNVFERPIDAMIKSIKHQCAAISQEEDPIHTHRGMGFSIGPASPIAT